MIIRFSTLIAAARLWLRPLLQARVIDFQKITLEDVLDVATR